MLRKVTQKDQYSEVVIVDDRLVCLEVLSSDPLLPLALLSPPAPTRWMGHHAAHVPSHFVSQPAGRHAPKISPCASPRQENPRRIETRSTSRIAFLSSSEDSRKPGRSAATF